MNRGLFIRGETKPSKVLTIEWLLVLVYFCGIPDVVTSFVPEICMRQFIPKE